MIVLFIFFLSLTTIQIANAGNYKDTSFSFDRYSGITDPREKTDTSSVYLDLSNASPKGEIVRVYIIDSDSDIIRSYGGDFFRCELGKKYFLYNSVREKGGSRCRLYITGHPEPISGKWSPDSIPQSGVITMKNAYYQSDEELSSERANDALSALFGNINIHFTTFDQTYQDRVGEFLVQASLKNKITISSESKMSCSISHSIFVSDKKFYYNWDITFKGETLKKFKELLNKLLNENPKNFFDRVKFAMRDGSVTLIPLDDLGFKIVLEFKRNPNRQLTNTGELEIIVFYLGSPPPLKQYVFARAENLSNKDFSRAMERSFSINPSSAIKACGYGLFFVALEVAKVLA